MNHNIFETVLGGVVLFVAAIFLTLFLSAADFKKVNGYAITANFSKISGINTGADVRISGVKIGSVSALELDPKTYLAKVTMSIADDIALPLDTVAKISSESLLGGKYISLEPGAEEDMLKNGGQIQYTQAAVDLEEMIGKFIFSGAEDKNKKPSAADAADTDAAATDGLSGDY